MKKQTLLAKFAILSLAITTLTLNGCGSGDGTTQPTAIATMKTAVATQPAKFVPDELLVQFVAGVPKGKVEEVLHGQGALEVDEIKAIRVKKIKVPPQALEQVKNALAHNPHVRFAENNFIAEADAVPNDPSYGSQWHLPKISAPQGWDITEGMSSIDIAVIDSGVDLTHPDLAGKLLPGFNFRTNTSDGSDVYGHGTKVAGAAAAISNNGLGVAGVAWNCSIMPLVIADSTGLGDYFAMAQAIIYAVDHGVRIMNISYGGPGYTSTLQDATDYAWNKGAVIFASAGNSNTSTTQIPASLPNVVAVAATDSSDNKASYSNFGSWITVAAPGSAITTTAKGGGYASVSGTSFSSPITAGLGALVLSVNPTLSNRQVVDIITQNADDLGVAGFDQYFGFGRINVARAVAAAKVAVVQSDTQAPTVSIASPASGAVVKGSYAANVSAADNVAVTKVELYVNGALFASEASQPFVFSWDTTAQADGAYTLEARAYDAAGNVGSSGTISVTVQNAVDTVPPAVFINAPSNGTYVTGLNKVSIKVNGTDNTRVSRLEIYIDGVLKDTSTSSSLSYNWNPRNVAIGRHTISSRPFDSAANNTTSVISVIK